jgi:hypothetical protein
MLTDASKACSSFSAWVPLSMPFGRPKIYARWCEPERRSTPDRRSPISFYASHSSPTSGRDPDLGFSARSGRIVRVLEFAGVAIQMGAFAGGFSVFPIVRVSQAVGATRPLWPAQSKLPSTRSIQLVVTNMAGRCSELIQTRR